jgi:hypothetical protein
MYKIKFVVNVVAFLSSLISFITVATYINPLFSFIFFILFFSGIYFEKKNVFPVPRVVLNLFSVLVVLFSIFQISLENMVLPVVEALVVLLGIKLIENRSFLKFKLFFFFFINRNSRCCF